MGMPLTAVPRAASTGERAVARTATNPTAVLIGRAGFVAREAVYFSVGWLAVVCERRRKNGPGVGIKAGQ